MASERGVRPRAEESGQGGTKRPVPLYGRRSARAASGRRSGAGKGACRRGRRDACGAVVLLSGWLCGTARCTRRGRAPRVAAALRAFVGTPPPRLDSAPRGAKARASPTDERRARAGDTRLLCTAGERRVGGEGRGVRSRLVGDRRAEERGHGRATRAHSVRANGGRALPQPALERAVRTDSDEQARTDTDRERPGFAAAALERRGARDSALAVAYAPPCLTRCTVELGTRSPDLRGLRYGRARGAKAIRGARSSAAARVTCARRWTWTRRRVVRDGGGGVTSGRWRRGLVMLETRAGSLIALVG